MKAKNTTFILLSSVQPVVKESYYWQIVPVFVKQQ